MIDDSPLPAGWRALAVPSDWNFDEPELRIRPVTVDYVTYPDDFFMLIQTPEMIAEQEPTGIIASFKASESEGVRLVKIYGIGARWLDYLGEVVAQFPPTEWTKRAKSVVVKFLQLPEVRQAFADTVGELPLAPSDSTAAPAPEPGVQRRRKITPQHLEEVAKIYNEAQCNDEPPTRAVQNYFGVSHSTAAKWVGAARRSSLLPPV
ncbi:hypothetical protein JL475_30680 [Streptomyces sp. M2CJ-2]|uniref:hypothetical protein n=1 Tax=Streptomyces sp. M2CJ-2 TaxID=2803948 RepID=UPI001925694D|nr:hypothetical protein [Streptomyces sp. M2CJ-2]MBL3670266.1 hypothetical protein [Streptomyces sp. M2CJ-2]